MAYFSRPEEVLVELRDRLSQNKGELGLQNVLLGEEELLLDYPLVQIVGEPIDREIATLSQFQVIFHAAIWIYHADLSVGHEKRTIDEMKLATGVVEFLHRDENRHLRDNSLLPTNPDRLIFSYVDSELPGRIRRPGSPSIISTRLGWQGESRVLFEES